MNRKEHWDKAHAARHPREVSWYQQLPALSLRMIQKSNMAMDTPLIDVGGGASLLVDFLLEEGYRDITVLDLSGIALKKARRRLADQASRVELVRVELAWARPGMARAHVGFGRVSVPGADKPGGRVPARARPGVTGSRLRRAGGRRWPRFQRIPCMARRQGQGIG